MVDFTFCFLNFQFDAEGIIGLVIWFLCVLYSSIRTASSSQSSKLTGSDKLLVKDNGETNGDAESQKVWYNENEEVFYIISVANLVTFYTNFLP